MKRHAWQTWLILIALAIRSVVPAGYMLAAPSEPGGLPQVVICTSGGMKLVTLGPDGAPREERSSGEDGLCAFALPTVAVLAEPPSLVLPAVGDSRMQSGAQGPVGRLMASHSWQARAPPAVLHA